MLSENPLKLHEKASCTSHSQSQDSLSKYSRPFVLEEKKTNESQNLEIDKLLVLEDNMHSLLQRLQEAQAKSYQNRKNLLQELTKEDKFLEKEVIIPQKEQDDLLQFFTNQGELRTLNEEHLEDLEKRAIEEKFQAIPVKNQIFLDFHEEIGLEGNIF